MMIHRARTAALSTSLFLFAGLLHAQVRPAPGRVSAMFVGETGAPPQVGPGAGDAMETVSRQQGGDGTFGRIPDAAGKPKVQQPPKVSAPVIPQDAVAQAPAPALPPALPDSRISGEAKVRFPPVAPKVPSQAVASNPAPSKVLEREEKDRKRYSLWDGLAAPLALAGDKVKDASPDTALALGRKDYDLHILQSASNDGPALARADARPAAASSKEVFVSVDLDLKTHPVELRDAVAGLVRAADFRPDPRFDARYEGTAQERASVWGWVSADKLGAAMQAPAVSRLEVQAATPHPGRRAADGAVSEMLVGIRMPAADAAAAPQAARETLARVLPELSADARFVLKRVIGYQAAPQTKQLVAVVEGDVPLKNLSRLMAHPDVVKVVSSPDAGAPVPAEAPAPAKDFWDFAWSRSPALILLTLLLALPALSRPSFLRLVEIFIPYSR